MADITEPVVVRFSNDYLRPLSEAVRNLGIRLNDAKVEYTTIISDLISGNADGDLLADGSPADGRSQVTKKDIVDLLSMLNSLLTEINATGNDSLMAKFTVRPAFGSF